jgi:molybdopterin synthase sulfur carrier subunit
MLNIQYFASLRETLGRSSETVALPAGVGTVTALVNHLATSRGGAWQALQDTTAVLVAVNQTIVDRGHALTGTEEVAFFPPMTGG